MFEWLDKDIFIQIIGYAGMALVIISFLFKDIKTVRLVNIAGSALSIVFAINTPNNMPTVVLNLALLLINTAMLVINRIKRKREKQKKEEKEKEGK